MSKTGLTITMKGNRIIVQTPLEIERKQMRKDDINAFKLWILSTIVSGSIIYTLLKLTQWIISTTH
jgi:hypothetical protein